MDQPPWSEIARKSARELLELVRDLSFDLLVRASKVLPIGPVYAIFTGIGTLGSVAVDAVFSDEVKP